MGTPLSPILFLPKERFFFFNFGSCVEEGQIKRGMRLGKRGLCLLSTGVNFLSSAPFLKRLS